MSTAQMNELEFCEYSTMFHVKQVQSIRT